MQQLWRLLEDHRSLAGVRSDWHRWLDGGTKTVARWIRPREDLVQSLRAADGRWLRIVEHADGDVVGVDDEAGTSIAVEHADRVIHELDLDLLVQEAAIALAVAGAPEKMGRRGWSIGYLDASFAAERIPVFLVLPSSSEELISFAGTVAASATGPFVLLTATDRTICATVSSLLRSMGAAHGSLESLLSIKRGRLFPIRPLAEAVRAILRTEAATPAAPRPTAASSPSTDALRDKVARLKAMERDCLLAVVERGITDVNAANLPGQEKIAKWAGYPWDASLKASLATLVKAGFLGNGRHHGKRGGYFATGLGGVAADLLSKS